MDTINHEVVHLVDFVSHDYFFTEEKEFKAYLHEYINKKIRYLIGTQYDKYIAKEKKQSKVKPRKKM